MYWGRCYNKRWATMMSRADPCCHGSHQCLLQTIYLPSQQPSVSPIYYLPCCHGSYHYVLQMLYIIQWHPPVSPAHHLPHATADTGLPFHASMHFHTTIMYLRVTYKLWRRTFTTACGKYNACQCNTCQQLWQLTIMQKQYMCQSAGLGQYFPNIFVHRHLFGLKK